MITGLYTLTKDSKPLKLLTSGRYRRKKEIHFFWHTVTLDVPTLLEVGKTYGVVFPTKVNGLLHLTDIKPRKETLADSFNFRFRN